MLGSKFIQNTRTYDAVILGSGLGGLISATKLASRGLRVAIITKMGPARGGNTGFAMGSFTAPNSQFTKEEHYEKTLEAGRGLNDTELVQLMIDRSPEVFDYFQNITGWLLKESYKGYHVKSPTKLFPGNDLLTPLQEKIKDQNVDWFTFSLPIEILESGGRCEGVCIINREGQFELFKSSQVIIATGGFAGVYRRSNNPPGIQGEGLILAYRAGARLRDLEFVQFYPIGYEDDQLPVFMVPTPYPETARLVNEQDENILSKYNLEPKLGWACITQRDRLSEAMRREQKQGVSIYLDCTHCDPSEFSSVIKAKPFHPLLNRPVKVSPVSHFTMGGIVVNKRMETDVKGLYAIGEAIGGVHGANRLGGNALTEALTSGYMAAETIEGRFGALVASDSTIGESDSLQDYHIRNPLLQAKLDDKKNECHSVEYIAAIKKELGKVCDLYLGPLRNHEDLERGKHQLLELYKELTSTTVCPSSRVIKWREAYSVEMAIDLMVKAFDSADKREESRGSHVREEFPDKNQEGNKSIIISP